METEFTLGCMWLQNRCPCLLPGSCSSRSSLACNRVVTEGLSSEVPVCRSISAVSLFGARSIYATDNEPYCPNVDFAEKFRSSLVGWHTALGFQRAISSCVFLKSAVEVPKFDMCLPWSTTGSRKEGKEALPIYKRSLPAENSELWARLLAWERERSLGSPAGSHSCKWWWTKLMFWQETDNHGFLFALPM